jgi:hypothetical protein
VTRQSHSTSVETLLARDSVARRAVAKIRKFDGVIRSSGRRLLIAVMQQGRELKRLKARLEYGDWLKVRHKKFPWLSDDTAENRINVSLLLSRYGIRRLRNLPFETLCVIARRNVPEQARITLIERAAAGEKISATEARRSLRCSSTEPAKEAVRAALFPNAPAKPVPVPPAPSLPEVEVIPPTVANLAAVREARDLVDDALVGIAYLSGVFNALVDKLEHMPADNRVALFVALDRLRRDIERLHETHTIGGRSLP